MLSTLNKLFSLIIVFAFITSFSIISRASAHKGTETNLVIQKMYSWAPRGLVISPDSEFIATSGGDGTLKDSKPDDTFVLFVAGHGVHDTDAEETYYFLTHEADLKNLSACSMVLNLSVLTF